MDVKRFSIRLTCNTTLGNVGYNYYKYYRLDFNTLIKIKNKNK